MNQFTAPMRCDVAHHRNHFEPSVRAALGLLDRAAEGQDIPRRDIDLALHVTGDSCAFVRERNNCAPSNVRAQEPRWTA